MWRDRGLGQVELDDGGLVIRGTSKTESEAKEESYYRMERSVGTPVGLGRYQSCLRRPEALE
jgi:hypothetical protein